MQESVKKNYQPIKLVGLINHEVSCKIINLIDAQLKILSYEKNKISKVKLIVVEILENICKHQNQSFIENPTFTLEKIQDQLIISATNQIENEKLTSLETKLDEITKLSHEELQSKYVYQLENGKITASGNAGLGLLTVAKRSNNKIKYNFESKNSITMFNLEVVID